MIATNEAGRITIYSVILGDRANDRTELTFACVGMNESLLQCIYEYNATQSDCRIYAKDFSVQEDPYTALNLSLISGDVYDLICVNELPIQDYVRKGILADLAQFVDPAEFFQPYVKAVSIDGKMYQVSPDFVVYTIVGDKKSVGEQKGWSHKEFLEYLRKNEEHVTLGYADKQDLLRITCQNAMDDFLVREPGKAGIDERKMSETLQFVMEYQGPSADKYYQEGYQFLDVAHLEPTFLAETVLSSVGSYRILKDAYSGRLVAKGYPVEEGAGTYMGLGFVLIAIMIVMAFSKMPGGKDSAQGSVSASFGRLFKNKRYVWGVVAQFFYVGAQICVWSFTIRLVMQELGIVEADAASYYLASIICFCVARFFFTWLMKFFRPAKLMAWAAAADIVLCLIVILMSGSGMVAIRRREDMRAVQFRVCTHEQVVCLRRI